MKETINMQHRGFLDNPNLAKPLSLAGKKIWFFSGVPWDFSLLGRTWQLARGLAQLGASVTFVEPPSWRKLIAWAKTTKHAGNSSAVTVISSIPTVQKITDRIWFSRALHDQMQKTWLRFRLKNSNPLAIVSTPRWMPILQNLPISSIIYDCNDDLAVHADHARIKQFEYWESLLIKQARSTLAVSSVLARSLEKKGAKNVIVHGNGVSYADFCSRAGPPQQRQKKRIGYLGAIYEWVDITLLQKIAAAFPQCEIELIGPVRRGIDISTLFRFPNVKISGYLPYSRAPAAMAQFDVALIPFLPGDVALASDPIKIYEYFCFGLPVVSTPVGDLERLKDLLYVAKDHASFLNAITSALSENSPERKACRMKFAKENDWSERVTVLANLITST